MRKSFLLILVLLVACFAIPSCDNGSGGGPAATINPIVLVHGAFFKDENMLGIDYWWGIPAALEDGGAEVYVTQQRTFGTSEERALDLATELAYTVSASMACKEALSKGEPFLLEPIMNVEAFVPESFMGDVIGDLNARGGKIESINPKADTQVIKAIVPLSKMFGYSTSLRSATQGRGTFTMQFSHFDQS